MAIPQPTRLDQLGKMYSSYFRPDDVRVLAITTNWNKIKQKTHIKYNCWCFIPFHHFILHIFIKSLLFAKVQQCFYRHSWPLRPVYCLITKPSKGKFEQNQLLCPSKNQFDWNNCWVQLFIYSPEEKVDWQISSTASSTVLAWIPSFSQCLH